MQVRRGSLIGQGFIGIRQQECGLLQCERSQNMDFKSHQADRAPPPLVKLMMANSEAVSADRKSRETIEAGLPAAEQRRLRSRDVFKSTGLPTWRNGKCWWRLMRESALDPRSDVRCDGPKALCVRGRCRRCGALVRSRCRKGFPARSLYVVSSGLSDKEPGVLLEGLRKVKDGRRIDEVSKSQGSDQSPGSACRLIGKRRWDHVFSRFLTQAGPCLIDHVACVTRCFGHCWRCDR